MAAFQGEIRSMISFFMMFWYLRISICGVYYGADDENSKIITLNLLRDTVTVSTCPGEQLLFKCVVSATNLRWIVTIPLIENGVNFGSRTVTHTSEMISSLIIESYPPMGISFNVSRFSAFGALPLVSTLDVTNVVVGLNGTEVNCSSRSSINSTSMVAAIHIINSGHDVYPRSSLNILNSSEVFMANAITVTLEWEREAGVTYNASIYPAALTLTENARLQLKLSYNTLYSVTIIATLCGQNSVNTALNFSYVKCSDTFRETLMHSADSDVFLEGANITFTCPPGQVLIGHSTSTCMGNGEWEPDPREVMCKVTVDCGVPPANNEITLAFNSTLEASQLLFWCDESPNETMIASCLSDGRWSTDIGQHSCTTKGSANIISRDHYLIIAMVSSIIFTAAVFFIIGCISGQLWQKHRGSAKISEAEHTSPVAELNTIPTEQDHLEMMENVAYGPLKCTTAK